jgi:O-antigen/teichoic acid export membrane protein
LAVEVMPIVSVAVIFQILSYQYLHISFLLSGRNAFYLLNTGSVLAFNAVISYLLIARLGAVGAAWGRLAAELFGFFSALVLVRWAFPVPVPYRRLARVLFAAAVMAVIVKAADWTIAAPDRDALAVLLPLGIASYLMMCWLLDVANGRAHASRVVVLARKIVAQREKRVAAAARTGANEPL